MAEKNLPGRFEALPGRNEARNYSCQGRDSGSLASEAGGSYPRRPEDAEDCGYTSAYEMFSEQLGVIFGLPSFPIMDCVDAVSWLKTGARLSEASPIEAVKHIRVPVLFIHGDADKLIPIAMMRDMYEQCPTKKKMLVVEGAGHGDAMKQDMEAYWGVFLSFFLT